MSRGLTAIFVLLLLCGCGDGSGGAHKPAKAAAMDPAFVAGNTAWRTQRQQDLLQPDGWTSLVGLHWLELKAHYIGSGAASGIRLAVGPAKLGMVSQQGDAVYFTPEPGLALTYNGEPLTGRVEFMDDHQATPGVIGFDDGKGKMTLIQRGGRHALRVKHADAASRTQFSGLQYWPLDPGWKVQARFIANPPDSTLPMVDIIGTTTDAPSPGVVEFQHAGQTYRLQALAGENGGLFLVFADRTSGHGSYPAGRFLDTVAPLNGKLTLDFNQSYNPPCAFTPFATCPLPPADNRLDVAIEAGEKAYRHGTETH
ncbi:hypothetical protein ABB29_10690 [Pseudoxanthomonas dokdonensis]|uniref:DUF1684 domain-containing protein n=2 Tax=Pseudoxanthomonas dokdonensis TaxID=344882 RepID=A0A0R0CSP6_9GAMM|nr:hypothetical protein ABB29_10690 [Pseudoxanthomonas dokdonensis]